MPHDRRIFRFEPDTANSDLLQRLLSANGHLQAVIAMVEAGEPCESILHQLGAVQAALKCAGRELILCELEQIDENLLGDSCPEARVQTVLRLSNLYSLLIKTQTNH